MDSCPKCKSTNFRKDGIVKYKQRYLCKDCKYRLTVEQIGKSNKVKMDALILYLEWFSYTYLTMPKKYIIHAILALLKKKNLMGQFGNLLIIMLINEIYENNLIILCGNII